MSSLRTSNVVSLPKRLPTWDYALVPDSRYEARVLGNETRLMFRHAPKLVVWWSLVEMGHVGTVIPAWYSVPKVTSSRPRRNGYYNAVKKSSKLARHIAAMIGNWPTVLHGPFPMDLVQNHIYEIETRTVTQDRDQVELHEATQYSCVDRVLRRVQ